MVSENWPWSASETTSLIGLDLYHTKGTTLIPKCHLWCSTGPCFRPLVIILYTHDLPNVLKCILFADDATIFQTYHNLTYLRECI